MYKDIDLLCSEVLDLLDLDLTLVLGLKYRINDCMCSLSVRHLGDSQGVLVDLLDLRTDLYDTTALTLHVL